MRLIPAVAATLLFAAPAAFAAGEDVPRTAAEECAPVAAQKDGAEDRAKEGQQRRLDRARRENETPRMERRERMEAQLRERQVVDLQGAAALAWRESYLRHEQHWTRREYDSMARDPSNFSALARRGALERELHDIRAQLGTVASSRENAVRRLDTLRRR